MKTIPSFIRIFGPALSLALCLAFAAPSAFAAAAEETPVQAIAMLQKAIETKDTDLMERHIDLDAVLSKGADAVLADTQAVRRAEETSPAIALVLSGLGSDERARAVAKQLLTSETKQFVRYGVSSGAFAGTAQKGPHAGAGLFGSLLRGGAKDKKTFGPATLRSRSGSEARVSATLDDAASKQSYPLDLLLRQKDGIWRVTEISNIHTLIRQATKDKDEDKGKGKRP